MIRFRKATAGSELHRMKRYQKSSQPAELRGKLMIKGSDQLERMRVASACSVDWNAMAGEDRVRFCHQSNLNPYNISKMTPKEVKAVMASTEGRLCVGFYRRAGSTILTQDCPVGLPQIRWRAARLLGAALTLVISFCVSTFGQAFFSQARPPARGNSPLKIRETRATSQPQSGSAALSGMVVDITGAALPGAQIILINERSKKEEKAASTDEGKFQFPSLEAGSYSLKVEMRGFKTATLEHVSVRPNQASSVNAVLEVSGAKVEMGVIFDSIIDLSKTSVTTTIDADAAGKLPIP